MATVDIPEHLWAFIEEHDRKKSKKAEDLLTTVLDDYRRRETVNTPTTLAPQGYGLRPEDKKGG